MTTGKPSKRLDLQGIRGLAIIVVLGFHFYPNIFPNGYLGVDQFFVLSGFLMCMLLKRGGGGGDNMQSCSLITLFYSKRFKRILPLYLLIILLSLLSLYTIFPDTAIESNVESAGKALLFVSNRPKTDQEDYFQMLSIAIDIFTHTWSLSVEIQFYFLVPFLYLIGVKLPQSMIYPYYTIIGSISFIYSLSCPSTIAFNSVFARIWQFMIGMIVYHITDNRITNQQDYKPLRNEEEEIAEKLIEKAVILTVENEEGDKPRFNYTEIFYSSSFKYFVLFSMIYVNTYPTLLSADITRPYVTILTGLLMLISMDDYLLSNRIVTYIGDISYSLYLIHWPIYAYWKLTMNDDKILLVVCLSISVILAVLSFEFFEKWYLTISSTSIGTLVVLLFFVNIVAINKDNIDELIQSRYMNTSRLDGISDHMTFDDAEKFNYKWNVQDMKNLMVDTCVYENVVGPLGWCNHTGLSTNGKYKMMIFGNSWTANHGNIFHQECRYKANTLLQGSAIGCEALYPTWGASACQQNFTDFATRLADNQPDYAFLIARPRSVGYPIKTNSSDLSDDKIYQTMKTQMLNFTKNVKRKLYILDPLPDIKTDLIVKLPEYIRSGKKLEDIDKEFVIFAKYEEAKIRHDQLIKDCGDKCERISYVPEFFEESTKTYRFYDEKGFSYFTSPHHLSPHGLEHIRHVYRDICRKL